MTPQGAHAHNGPGTPQRPTLGLGGVGACHIPALGCRGGWGMSDNWRYLPLSYVIFRYLTLSYVIFRYLTLSYVIFGNYCPQ